MELSNDQFFWLMLGGVAGIVIVVGVIAEYFTARLKTRGKIVQTQAREETKRELAAYVAEGSMTPEDAERIIAADGTHPRRAPKPSPAEA